MAINPVIIGSRDGYWQKVGRVTIVNAASITPFKESDIDGATAGSLLKYEVERGMLALMLRCRIATQSGSARFDLKVAKGEIEEPLTGASIKTPFEKFYDNLATEVTFTTGVGAIAAERGGFYADGFSVAGTDDSLKGIGSVNANAKTTFVDILGFPFNALILTAITGDWAEIDISNS